MIRAFVLFVALCLPLAAQQPPGKPEQPPVKPERNDPIPELEKDPPKDAAKDQAKTDGPDAPALTPYLVRRSEKFRFRILTGAGYEMIRPAILSEAGPAWQLNSLIRASNGISQPAILIQDTKRVPAYRYKLSGDIAFKDRVFFDYERQWTNQQYNKGYPTRVSFAAPANSSYETALYEGLRMLKYKEFTDNASLTYLHPLGKGVKIGGFLEHEAYHENLEISMGSTSLTKVSPGILTWSQAGTLPASYQAKGNTAGLAVRYQMLEWLGFSYRVNPIRRSGDFKLSGPQILNAQNGVNGPVSYAVVAPIHYAEFSDSGIRHRFETTFRFLCRYYVIPGIIREEYKRSYSIYVGNTLATVGNFTPKTSGIGFGEMASSHKATKQEVFLKFGAAFFL